MTIEIGGAVICMRTVMNQMTIGMQKEWNKINEVIHYLVKHGICIQTTRTSGGEFCTSCTRLHASYKIYLYIFFLFSFSI